MALRTSVATGLWSAAGTWDTGVPVDTDTFTIAATHTVTFDVDQSAFAGLGASTIAATGTLIASTTAGAYVLKMNGDLTVNGTLQAGTSLAVPYPNTCTFDINFSGGSNSIVVGAAGRLYLYCTKPTYRYVRLTGIEAVGQTVLSVDTDVTGDIWAVGDRVDIVDNTGTTSFDIEWGTIAATAATTITVDISGVPAAGLAAQKEIGTYIVRVQRNIRLYNSTDHIIKNVTNSTIGAEFLGDGTDYSVYPASTSAVNNVFDGCAFSLNLEGVFQSPFSTFNNCTFSRHSAGIDRSNSSLITDCEFIGNSSYHVGSCDVSNFTNVIMFASSSLNYLMSSCKYVGCDFHRSANAFYVCADFILRNCDFKDVTNGVTGSQFIVINCTYTSGVTNAVYGKNNHVLYNCDFSGATTEFSSYNVGIQTHLYTESLEHNQVVNAYKAVTLGGLVTSQTTSPPTGYTIFYRHAVENASYPVFRQYAATVQSHTALEVDAVIRNTDGIDVSATTPIDLRPRLEIIDQFADPLVDSTATPLDTVALPIADGTNTTWQEVKGIWANTGDSPRQVYVRIITYSHDTSNHNIDEAWSVASYQDQIAALYNSLIPIRTEVATADTTTSFTLTDGQAAVNAYRYNTLAIQDATDAHWEQRKILSWTAGRVVIVDHAFTFTPAAGDLAYILSAGYGEDDLIIAGTVPDATSTANSIKLGANASATDNIYNENLITLTGGTGSGQARLITDYVGATKVASVRNPWVTTPDATTTYRISPFSGILLANTGVCNGATANTITLRTPAPATADLYNGHTIFISGGTGAGQARIITDYSAALVATVDSDWNVTPVADDSIYLVLPIGLGGIYTKAVDILANTGKVVYGSVTDTGGIPRAIQTGSVTGFVEDEKL